eukprot:TRINITY_DN5604_c0_g1_i1.p1 TRINITY_DN5604_c0_g1~~TRINITY_DN5604_c0_g1_i1.p1  ORF type:complete len:56 (-),score=2.13 TRINITY_DN5604_c0_g1_i1:208-375(-)
MILNDFHKYVDGDFVDQFKSTGSIDISESDLNKMIALSLSFAVESQYIQVKELRF